MKKKFMLLAIVGLTLVGGGGASAYFFVLKDKPADATALADGEELQEGGVSQQLEPALYYNLPPLVVSANYQGRLRYLQVKLSVMTRDEETIELLQDNTPLLQDALILLLSSYEFTQLETTSGKEELRQASQNRIRELIGSSSIESVLFTGFVIQ